MSLIQQITKGIKPRPHFIGLYGPGGVGKSTMGATAPKPVFLGTDDGVATMDVASFPAPKTWADVKAAINELIVEKHEFETLVIDTINGLEPLLWAHVCREANCKSIEDVDGGYGKGYVRCEEEWVEFFRTLKRLRQKMNVIVLGHSAIKSVEDPYENERFDRYILKMDKRAAAQLHEAVDCMFFANFKNVYRKKKGEQKTRAEGDGTRRMFTEERPAFLAKSRFDLPFEMDLSWEAFVEAVGKCVLKSTPDELLTLFKGKESEATAYLISIGWLKEGQGLKDLLASKRKPVLSRPDDFLEAVRKFSEPKQEEETTTNESTTTNE